MKHPALRAALLAAPLALLVPPLAQAEIIVETGSGGDVAFAYGHPSLRSLVFISPEARQAALLPPAPIFLAPPPLLLRAPTAMPPYPPVMALPGFNVPAGPSNRDNANYNLQRAHGFSQNLYRENSALYFGSPAYGYGYGWNNLGPAYPPPQTPGFNQPARPSNRDNSLYNLERAHRFSMDGYKQP